MSFRFIVDKVICNVLGKTRRHESHMAIRLALTFYRLTVNDTKDMVRKNKQNSLWYNTSLSEAGILLSS